MNSIVLFILLFMDEIREFKHWVCKCSLQANPGASWILRSIWRHMLSGHARTSRISSQTCMILGFAMR